MSRSLAATERRHTRHIVRMYQGRAERAAREPVAVLQPASCVLTVGETIGNSMQAAFVRAATKFYQEG